VPGEYQTAIAEHKHFDTVLMTARMMEGQLLAQKLPNSSPRTQSSGQTDYAALLMEPTAHAAGSRA
jgi:hypothetical protein